MSSDGRTPEATRLVAQERPYPLVRAVLASAAREGLRLREFDGAGDGLLCQWAKAVAECVARGECAGGVVFCDDPALVCCVANKLPGLRAAAVTSVAQAARATLTLGANLLAVEAPGRTYFELRQMLRLLSAAPACPNGPAATLRELDGHAHR
jgi:Ribose/Galactose Isomerase